MGDLLSSRKWGRACWRVTATRCRRLVAGLGRLFASRGWVGACCDDKWRGRAAQDSVNLARSGDTTLGPSDGYSKGVGLAAEKAA